MLTENPPLPDTAWNEARPQITLADLALAYRKAKSDSFYERSMICKEAFARFEFGEPGSNASDSRSVLQGNLENLLARLHTEDLSDLLDDLVLRGEDPNGGDSPVFEIVPKALKTKRKEISSNRHYFVSDGNRSFKQLERDYSLRPDLRVIGRFPVALHILSALWINLIGHRVDACLDDCAYGSRLRRVAQDDDSREGIRQYHQRAPGLFEPYIYPYKRWRDSGTRAIKSRLDDDEAVLVLTMDLKSYYHNLDLAGFETSGGATSKLWDWLGFDELIKGKEPLDHWEKEFTQQLLRSIGCWQEFVRSSIAHHGFDKNLPVGLPIGLSAARLLANAYLKKWDHEVMRSLAPLYYGRYVDDMFLVLQDPGGLESHEEVLHYLMRCLQHTLQWISKPKDEDPGAATDDIRINLDYSDLDLTTLILQPEKMRVFMLSGQSGRDMLESIEGQLREVSSERRFMPDPEQLENGPAADVLTAAAGANDEPDGLRQAEGLSIKRLSWSILLYKAEHISHDLKPKEWRSDREKFYEFAFEHVIRPDRLLEHWETLSRLIGLAISCEDDKHAAHLIREASNSLEVLERSLQSGLQEPKNEKGGSAVSFIILNGVTH